MFYVYTYRDTRPNKNLQVIYVGKGQGRRAWVHWEKAVHKNRGFGAVLAKLRQLGLTPLIAIVKEFADEAEAFVEEMRLIAELGRRDLGTGTLFNMTDGGEGTAGALRTVEWRENMSAVMSTPEMKSKYAEANRLRWSDPDYRAKTTAAIREALRDPGVIARREAGKAAFIDTPEFRAVMARATTKMWEDPAYFEKVQASQLLAQNRPEVAAKRSVVGIKRWQDIGDTMAASIKAARNTEASKAKTSAQAKAQWADPEYAAKQKAHNKEIANRPEVKAAKAAATKALWADPVWRANRLAKNKKPIALPTATVV
jgi:hypothetical protein